MPGVTNLQNVSCRCNRISSCARVGVAPTSASATSGRCSSPIELAERGVHHRFELSEVARLGRNLARQHYLVIVDGGLHVVACARPRERLHHHESDRSCSPPRRTSGRHIGLWRPSRAQSVLHPCFARGEPQTTGRDAIARPDPPLSDGQRPARAGPARGTGTATRRWLRQSN